MLSDGTLRGIKPQATTYKITDRDGMYVTVSPRGTITFRLDYRLNGRRETLTIGRYGSKDGISLLMARERSMEARKAIAELMVVEPPTQDPCSTGEFARPIETCDARSRNICFIAGNTSTPKSRVRTHSPSSSTTTL